MARIKVALLNDYDVVVAGLAAMLQPVQRGDRRRRPLDRPADAAAPVDVALYDSYGRPGLDLERIAETVRQDNVRHVAVFTFDFHPRLVERRPRRAASPATCGRA